MQIYVVKDGRRAGPFTVDTVKANLAARLFDSSDLCWYDGCQNWIPLSSVVAQGPSSPIPTKPAIPPEPQLAAKQQKPHKISTGVKICAAVVAMLLLLVVAGIVAVDRDSNSASPPSPERLAAQLKASTVKIDGEFKSQGWIFDGGESWEGTGVIIKKEKNRYWILSNCHVLGFWDMYNAKKAFTDTPVILAYGLSVTFPDGNVAVPNQAWINSLLKDYCVLTVESPSGDFSALDLSNVQTQQGEKVYAMGNPLGLDNTFTSGVISGYRNIPSPCGASCRYIQTDAAINPGNSGGPLIDEWGHLIGLNTLKRTDGENLGFAITSTEILHATDQKEFVTFPLTASEIGPFLANMTGGN